MEMVRQFIGGQFDLGHLCRVAGSVPGDYEARLETVPASIETVDLGTACEIAEFVLNVLPMPSPPRWTDLERYVEERFKQPGGRYRFSCDQDFLRIARRS
jgi:hypothetical protein